MDRRQRIDDLQETLRMAFEGNQSQLWTALPGIIQSFNSSAVTCTVQPAISGTITKSDGTTESQRMPVLLDCPVVFPGGGGCTLTFPLTAGDECLVIFASRCIDSWWSLGGVKGQAEFRMHDLSDGFVIPGPKSQPRKISVAGKTQLRTDDGETYIEIESGKVTIKGDLHVTGTTYTANDAINLNTHVHGGVEPGSGTTSTPQ